MKFMKFCYLKPGDEFIIRSMCNRETTVRIKIEQEESAVGDLFNSLIKSAGLLAYTDPMADVIRLL